MELNQEEIKVILEFLKRANLRGDEVGAFNQVTTKLNKELQPQTIEKNVSKEKTK